MTSFSDNPDNPGPSPSTPRWEWDPARHFLLIANRAWTGNVQLNNLPGCGRIDAVCRAINAALWLSHGLREDSRFHALLLGPPAAPRLISFHPRYLKRVSPDERNIASHIRIALDKTRALPLGRSRRTEPGITVRHADLSDTIEAAAPCLSIYRLDRDGEAPDQALSEPQGLFILGDHNGLLPEQIELINQWQTATISISPQQLLASHAIVILHNRLDRLGRQSPR